MHIIDPSMQPVVLFTYLHPPLPISFGLILKDDCTAAYINSRAPNVAEIEVKNVLENCRK